MTNKNTTNLFDLVNELSSTVATIDRLQTRMREYGIQAGDETEMQRLLKDRNDLRSKIEPTAAKSMYDLKAARFIIFSDLKYRLSLPAGDEARIGADELLDELNRISPPIKESVPIPVCSLAIGQTPTVISAIEHLFKHQRADIIKYLNNSCE